MIKPLEAYMSQVEKTTQQYAWMDAILDEAAKKTDAYQKATAERAEAMKKATLLDAMGEAQYKLFEQINSCVNPWEKFADAQQNLTALLLQQGMHIEGWIAASKKNEETLLASSQYGTFPQKRPCAADPVRDEIAGRIVRVDAAGRNARLWGEYHGSGYCGYSSEPLSVI